MTAVALSEKPHPGAAAFSNLDWPSGALGAEVLPLQCARRMILRSSTAQNEYEGFLADVVSSSDHLFSEIWIEALSWFYRFDDHSAVAHFLREHPFLVTVLLEAHQEICARFGWDAHISLNIYADPESNGDRELFGLILTNLPTEDALARLRSFDAEWWLRSSQAAQGRLNFDIDFH